MAGGMASLVLPVRSDAGDDAVLKLQFPHRECEHEAAALAAWNGNGAAQLLAHDVTRHALLIERCHPGLTLSSVTLEAAIDAMVEVVPRLAIVAQTPPFTTLEQEAAGWASTLEAEWDKAGRPVERTLMDHVTELLRDLPSTQRQQVLVHQDLHADNVLAAERQPWLVIDPKPLIGEAEFMLAGMMRSFDFWGSRTDTMRAFDVEHDLSSVRRRLDRLSAELDLDRERMRGWAIVQLVAWCFDSSWIDVHLQTARWLVEA